MESPRSPCGVPAESRGVRTETPEFPLRAHTSHPSHPHSHDASPHLPPIPARKATQSSPDPLLSPPASPIATQHPPITHLLTCFPSPPCHNHSSSSCPHWPHTCTSKITALLWYAWLRHFDNFPHCLHHAFNLAPHLRLGSTCHNLARSARNKSYVEQSESLLNGDPNGAGKASQPTNQPARPPASQPNNKKDKSSKPQCGRQCVLFYGLISL